MDSPDLSLNSNLLTELHVCRIRHKMAPESSRNIRKCRSEVDADTVDSVITVRMELSPGNDIQQICARKDRVGRSFPQIHGATWIFG